MDKLTRACAKGRHTDRARRRQGSTNRNGMGATPSMARARSRIPPLLPAQGRQRDGPRQGDPQPNWPPGRTDRGNGTHVAPPPPTPPPSAGTPRTRRPTPRGAHSPKPGRGETGPDAPPPEREQTNKKETKQTKRSTGPGQEARRGTDRVERLYQRPAPGPRKVRAPHQLGEGGGSADAAGARAHIHTRDTRGIPEGQPDRARGTHRAHGMAYQRARARDSRTGRPATHSAGHAGREGGNGEDTTPGTGPTPPKWPRASRTHEQGTAPAKAVVAHRATHQPQG